MKENLLSDWRIHQYSETEYCLSGVIFNDSKGRFKDGQHITTSKLLSIDFNNHTAHTENSFYELEVYG